jgi:lauroyl/myristoyl acyltransferase
VASTKMQQSTTRSGLLCWQDVRQLAGLLGGSMAAAIVPRRWDPAVVGLLRSLQRACFPKALDQLAGKMARVLPADACNEPRPLAEEYATMRLEDMWGRVRGVRRHGWRPTIETEGLERVHKALERGRGAILWSMRFSSTTVIKQAFFRAGLPLTHLSREQHGSPSVTRLGVRVVSPLFCRAENSYLAERVQIPLDGSLGYLNQLRKRLRANACVSIFGEHEGRQSAEVEVLGARWRFALGAPSLAWLEGAELLTVLALRTAPFQYRVVIDEPIVVDRSAPRKEFAAQALAQFAERLERLIIAHPGQWQGWLYRSFEAAAGTNTLPQAERHASASGRQ